ncbi:MAG TPA: glycosyltransferase family 39 protein [Candidatus Hydrogenedentes bacterium]|nr:glycosyltransferase family 39 protein [Candidatus Hydrogenedentota bacterium]HPC17775.1 glycosyltransferase family 39 protein [Candidatus Hydrogenedentota bacterium]HRT21586.1 glycosyltransferase family 39 protein [Candidatus Hydrogenedentota bacterium]HRT66765.1 glycosyltransferase family 39 protein [Candidatus Hydrogenedentota bacterium]
MNGTDTTIGIEPPARTPNAATPGHEPTCLSGRAQTLQFLLLLSISAVVLGANIGGYSLWAPDEPRFGQIAREMLQSGDFLVPRVNGEPYKEKPPLIFWLVAAVSWPFGDVSEATARIPPVFLGVITVAMAYWLGRRLYGHPTGLWAGAILMTSALFFREARSMRTDILLTACIMAFFCAHQAWTGSRRTRWLVAMYAALGAGLLAKGPPALVFPALYLVAFYWRRWKDARGLHPVIGLAVALALVLAWYIPARMAVAGMADAHATTNVGQEAYRQIVGRLFTGVSHPRPPWYYLVNVPVSLLPWTLLLPWAIPWAWRNRRDPSTRTLLCWIVPAFVFFSISSGKREMYLLPAYPAMAILIARGAWDLAIGDHAVWRRRTTWAWCVVLLLLGAAPFALLATKHRDLWTPDLVLFGVAAMACLVHALWALRRETRAGSADRTGEACRAGLFPQRLVFLHFAILAVMGAHVGFPMIDARKSPSALCEPVRRLAEAGKTFRLYSAGFTSEEYIFYSKHFRKEVLNAAYSLPEITGKARDDLDERQQRMRGAVEKALDNISVADLASPTGDERAAIAAAVHDAIRSAEEDPVLANAYEKASDAACAAFMNEFIQPGPAFLYVEPRNWKRLLLHMPVDAECRILRHRPIGSRTILLVANKAGVVLDEAE